MPDATDEVFVVMDGQGYDRGAACSWRANLPPGRLDTESLRAVALEADRGGDGPPRGLRACSCA